MAPVTRDENGEGEALRYSHFWRGGGEAAPQSRGGRHSKEWRDGW
jgi:hypothetical protein